MCFMQYLNILDNITETKFKVNVFWLNLNIAYIFSAKFPFTLNILQHNIVFYIDYKHLAAEHRVLLSKPILMILYSVFFV